MREPTEPACRLGIDGVCCVVEIQNFDTISALHGHRFAARVVAHVRKVLSDQYRGQATSERFGNNRLLVIVGTTMPGVAFAARTLAYFEAPLDVEGERIVVDLVIGIGTQDPKKPGFTKIDAALEGLRQAKRRQVAYASGRVTEATVETSIREAELHAALHSDRLEVHYQPIFQTETLRARGAEALARLRATDGGLIPPKAFIPLAEATGLIGILGGAVLRQAAQTWVEQLGNEVDNRTLSVNISSRQIADPWFVNEIEAILSDTGLPAPSLELELTERSVLNDIDRSGAAMERLSRSGVRFALDDFGTGFSSLDVLARLPFATVKLDRSLVTGVTTSTSMQTVVRSVATMAHALGMEVVAEGIETSDQLDCVQALGCGMAQGFLLGHATRTPRGRADMSVFVTKQQRSLRRGRELLAVSN